MRRAKGYNNRTDVTAGTRKIQKMGQSYYIAIPPEFIKRHGLEKGTTVAVIANSILKVVPMQEIE